MQKGHANKPQHSVWYTPSFTTPSLAHNFVTHHLLPHHLSHTALSHTIFHTQLCHRFLSHTTFTHTIVHTKLCHKHHFLCRTPSFTHNFVAHTHHFSSSNTIFHVYRFVTHNSSHTTCFTFRSSTTSFVFPSFPVPATTFVAHYWKKLTCGVLRSFN